MGIETGKSALSALLEHLRSLRESYGIRDGGGGDADRRRITLLVCDAILDLPPATVFSLLGRPRSTGRAINDDEAVLFLVGQFEAAFYAALQEHALRCEPIETEANWREARGKKRAGGERREMRKLQFNPTALHNIATFSPQQALDRFPVIKRVISVLKNKEEKDGREPAKSHGGFDLAERLERRRTREVARRF